MSFHPENSEKTDGFGAHEAIIEKVSLLTKF